MSKSDRRAFLTGALPAIGLAVPAAAQQSSGTAGQGKRIYRRPTTTPAPPYSSELSYGNLVFVSGKGVGVGVGFKGDIKVQAARVLDQIEESLKAAGSSMEKVLKVNVYLSDIKNFEGLNEVYRPRFPVDPPVRTTIGGVVMPDGGLVEIDCIAYI